MPRFLDTLTGNFVWEDNPNKAHYAILSHTWRSKENGSEQLFHDILKLQKAVENFREDAQALTAPGSRREFEDSPSLSSQLTIFDHSHLSEKIKRFCKVALEAGYRLVWIDTCCINQSDSAELSEAINSMYEWYRLADVCYVYLPDVPPTSAENPTLPNSRFRRSRWHGRGWTLQELIAPEHVIFLAEDWCFLGTRSGLASTLQQVTGVDFDILTGMAPLDSVSVARRMSWAARRKTTRVEDRAYSLLGIFDVHLSPIYGEGGNAFLRLQEEIIRTIPDQSIFAWGPSSGVLLSESRLQWWVEPDVPCLLASSPSAFEDARNIEPLSPSEFMSRLELDRLSDCRRAPPLHAVFTPQGVRIQLICLDITETSPTYEAISRVRQTWIGGCDDCKNLPQAKCLALLQCQASRSGSIIALPLCRRSSGARLEEEEAYAIAPFMTCGHWLHEAPFRTVHLTEDAFGAMVAAWSESSSIPPLSTRTISLLRHVPHRPEPKSRQPGFVKEPAIQLWPLTVTHARNPALMFGISPDLQQELHVLGFAISPLICESDYTRITLMTSLTRTPHREPQRRGQRQHIKIRLTLTHIPPSEQSGDLDTAARFCIENYIRSPGSPARPPGSPIHPLGSPGSPGTPTGSPLLGFHDDPLAYVEAPCADDSEETSISEFSSRSSSQRILVEATFIIHADANWTQDTFDLRRLRLRLERPWTRVVDPSKEATSQLWLSAEISERFRYERPTGWDAHVA